MENTVLHTDCSRELELYYYGREQTTPGHCCGPIVRDHFLFHYIVSGKGLFHVRGKDYKLEAGNGFMIFPDQLFQYQADESEPWNYAWIAFNGSKAKECLQQIGLTTDFPIYSANNKDLIAEQFLSFIGEIGNALRELQKKALLYNLLDLLAVENIKDDLVQLPTSKDELVDEAIKIMVQELTRQLSIQDIANRLGVSRSHLFTVFKQKVGHSPKQHLKLLRLEMSLEYLRNPNYRIGEVANSVGYSDPLFYSKEFKSWLGVSPTKFREKEL